MTVYHRQRLPWIFWGDGSQGQLLEKRPPKKNDEGVEMVQIRFRPTEELLSRYGIPRSDLDHEFSLSRWYPKAYVHFLSEDPLNNTVLIMCDVKSRDTKLTNMKAYLLDTVMGYEKRIKSLQAQNAWLHSQLQKMSAHMEKYIEENANMFLKAIKVRGEIDQPFPAQGEE